MVQIVDIGNFNMKLNGRWFPQIVDSDSRNLYICDDPWEYMCLWVTLDIMGLLYLSHSVWPDPLLG